MSHSSRSQVSGRHQSPEVRQGPLAVSIGPCRPWKAIQVGTPSFICTVASSAGRKRRRAMERGLKPATTFEDDEHIEDQPAPNVVARYSPRSYLLLPNIFTR